MKIEQIIEGPNSAALHRANASIRIANEKYKEFVGRVQELLTHHKEVAAEDGTSVNGIELSDDLEHLLQDEDALDTDRRMSNRAFSGKEG